MSTGPAQRLRDERLRMGLTQRELSRRMGYNPQTVMHLESDRRARPLEVMARMATAGIDVNFVLTGASSPVAADEMRIVAALRKLPADAQRKLAAFIEALPLKEGK